MTEVLLLAATLRVPASRQGADDISHRVIVFDNAGRVQQRLGTHGAVPGQLLSPDAVHWDDDRLYVTDAGANRMASICSSLISPGIGS